MTDEEIKDQNKEKDGQEPEKKEAPMPLFSDEVFKDKLDLGEDDLDKLPV